ncbi:sugar phosphate isomerase/epimerase family protein [Georgenia alba]|uniref:Sugar phosphate isomerase/epimerase family protein n=1 Tax=Georgenia alba TaxID=2233858 RepID=A0ABW2Q5R6_9MICO
MRFGIHSMVWVGDWSEASARFAIESSAKAGYDLIELSAMDPSVFDVEMTARLLAENGLGATASLGLDAATDVSSEDEEIVAVGRRRLFDALHLVRDVGGDMLCGVIFSALRKYDEPATERGVAHSQAVIADLADEAAASGIRLGLEFCNRYETNILNTTEQTLAYIDQVGRDNVLAHLDTYHMHIEERSMRDPVLAAARAGRLGYVHVGESHRGPLGTGNVRWDEFLPALTEAGYDGVVTFESFSSEVVHPALSSTLAIWRNLWSDNHELARHARDFLADRLER